MSFTSGTNIIDWGDGSAIETLSSTVEKTHSYSANAIYKVRIISTDLTKILYIRGDNSRIAGIVDLSKLTGINSIIYL